MKILILYTGQSRLITQCWPWQERAFKEAVNRFPNIEIELRYGIWDKAWDVQLNRSDLLDTIYSLTNEFKIIGANVFSQDAVMQSSYNDYTQYFDQIFDYPNSYIGTLENFSRAYGQLKCRELAINKIKESYDAVFVTRTDVIFNTEVFCSLLHGLSAGRLLYRTSYEYKSFFVFCDYLEYRDYMGIASSDQVFLSTVDGLKLWYSNFDTKFKNFIEFMKTAKPNIQLPFDPHLIAVAWAHNPKETIKESKTNTVLFRENSTLSNLSTILRPQLIDTPEAKNPSEENLYKLNLMGKPYVGGPVDTANISRVY